MNQRQSGRGTARAAYLAAAILSLKHAKISYAYEQYRQKLAEG